MKKETTIGIPCFYWLWSDQQVQREVQSNLLEELDKSDDVLAAFAYLEVRNIMTDASPTSFEKYVVRLFCEPGDLNSLTDEGIVCKEESR